MVDLCGCVWTIFIAIEQTTSGPTSQDEALRLMREGRYAEARPLLAKLVQESAGNAEAPYRSSLLLWLGTADSHLGRPADAQRAFEEGLGLGAGLPEVRLSLLALLAEAHLAQGHLGEANQTLRDAESIAGPFSPEHPRRAALLDARVRLLVAQGQPARATGVVRQGLAILEESLGPVHPTVAAERINLGSLLVSQHREDEAMPLLTSARQVLIQGPGRRHPSTIVATYELACAHLRSSPAAAETLLREALTVEDSVGRGCNLLITKLLQPNVDFRQRGFLNKSF